MKLHILAAVGALTAASVVFAAAERPSGPGRGPGHPDVARLQQELGLSTEQADQLRKIWTDERKQAIRRRADIAVARIELEEALDARTLDEKAVAAKEKALADLQVSALEARTSHRLALRRLLSPEQQEKMRQLMRRRFVDRGQRGDWTSRRQRPGRGPAMAPPPSGTGGPGPDDEGDTPPPDTGGR
jgi:Spy/CpxP family protein refolding chaperone